MINYMEHYDKICKVEEELSIPFADLMIFLPSPSNDRNNFAEFTTVLAEFRLFARQLAVIQSISMLWSPRLLPELYEKMDIMLKEMIHDKAPQFCTGSLQGEVDEFIFDYDADISFWSI